MDLARGTIFLLLFLANQNNTIKVNIRLFFDGCARVTIVSVCFCRRERARGVMGILYGAAHYSSNKGDDGGGLRQVIEYPKI